MLVYIIRHAIALERDEWHEADDLRPLTEAGIEKMRRVAAGLASAGVRLDALWSSPLVRARQTAEIVQAALDLPRIDFTDLMRPEAKPKEMPRFLERFDRRSAVGLVGHEPHVSVLLGYLVRGDPEPLGPFKKGGVACVEFGRAIRGGDGQLLWLMQPKHLAAITKRHDGAEED